MAESRQNKHLRFSHFSRRQQDAHNDRVFIRWIEKRVNKQVEKRIAELRAEFQLVNIELRQQVEAELKKYLGEREVKEAGATPPQFTRPDRECTAARQLEEEEGYNSHREEDEEQVLDQMLSADPSETPNRSDDGEIRPLSADDHRTSHQTECGPIKNQTSPSDAPSFSKTSQTMKESEEKESTESPVHASVVSEQKREQEGARVDETKIDDALLMENQWIEWLNEMEERFIGSTKNPQGTKKTEKERRVDPGNRNPQGKKKTEKQENTEKHTKAARQRKRSEHTDTMSKIRTSVRQFFCPSSHKWEKLD